MARLTTKDFIKKAIAIHGDCYDYSKVKYKHNKLKIIIVCKKHGEFEQTPANHIYRKRGCKKCSIDNFKFTTKQFIKKAIEVHGDKYDYSLVKYDNYYKKVKIICKIHGEFEQTPNIHISGGNCQNCLKITTENFIKKSIDVHGNKYDYSDTNYINAKTKVVIKCPKHGEFKQVASYHTNGNGCPKCNESRGEAAIARYLDEHNIKYLRERKLGDTNLRYDFYIKKLNLIIEYDGRQHFESIKDFGGIEEFKLIQERDKIKNKYCKDNGIKLIRISYKKLKQINEILNTIFVA